MGQSEGGGQRWRFREGRLSHPHCQRGRCGGRCVIGHHCCCRATLATMLGREGAGGEMTTIFEGEEPSSSSRGGRRGRDDFGYCHHQTALARMVGREGDGSVWVMTSTIKIELTLDHELVHNIVFNFSPRCRNIKIQRCKPTTDLVILVCCTLRG